MKKFSTIILFIFITLIGIAHAASPKKLTVILSAYPAADHAPLIVAAQKGFFKQQGLEVQFIDAPDRNIPALAVAKNKADIAVTYEPSFIKQVDEDLPLIHIGTLIDKPLHCLITLKSSGIKSIADLKGKRVALSHNGLSTLMLEVMLAKRGLSTNDVSIVPVSNLSNALLAHQVDAIVGVTRNVEAPILEENNQLAVFFPEENGVPNYSELIFVANINNKNDPRFPRFLTAVKQAIQYLDAHPHKAWAEFAKAYPRANNPANRASWFATLPYFAEEPEVADHQEWLRFAEFMKKNDLIQTVQTASRYNNAALVA